MAHALSRVKFFNSGMDFTTLPHFLLCFRVPVHSLANRPLELDPGYRPLTVAAQQKFVSEPRP